MTESVLFLSITLGFIIGLATRLQLLRTDYRQYPSLPHNYVSHLAFGGIAAAIGAVAVPALWQQEFTAVTFLALAATQFREVRDMERQTLLALESFLLVPRGADYIEGIAAVFEARNYLAMATALIVSTATVAAQSWWGGGVAALIVLPLVFSLQSGGVVGDLAHIRPGRLHFEGQNLYIDDIYLANVGTQEQREQIKKFSLGLILQPANASARAKLANPGQRQAILHEIAAALGTHQEIAEPELSSLARKNIATGDIGLIVAPNKRTYDLAIAVAANTPLLESARGSLPGVGGSNKKPGKARKGEAHG